MHSLLINLSFLISQPTGITTYAKNVVPYLKGLQPTLLVGEEISDYNCYLIPQNLTPDYGKKGHFNRLVWTQQQLPKIYKNLRSRLLFSPVPEAPLFSDCRSVVMVHDFIPLRFPSRRSPLLYYHRYYIPRVLEQAEGILCNSTATARDISNFCQIPAKKIMPIPLGYDAKNFRYLDLPNGNYFLYVGRSDPYKNLHRLIDAFGKIAPWSDSELWLAGSADPRYTPELKAQVRELGLSERVKFLEYVPYEKLPVLMNQAIALVFPSLWEGFGLPVLEAMACGTPVITSNRSSLPELAGDAAILVDPYNVREIASAMQLVAISPTTRSRLREQGLARASQFSWAKTGALTCDVLKQYL
ncbi:glycosyltransferase family 4 protein [Phormidium sp. CCY1219]|uniref:glycosyltransferase family 4 protein n=1 Tax=Phormidium sp. CCY1219 TaxID=2886104 RepID=UPI002D1F7E2E|nr:glycosyltransferase family 1 protein [Phormidium sp. CCY1219]MEB3828969.1 glycosyltransferase family 4 protein [Phormidium sp. CCY1219]